MTHVSIEESGYPAKRVQTNLNQNVQRHSFPTALLFEKCIKQYGNIQSFVSDVKKCRTF